MGRAGPFAYSHKQKGLAEDHHTWVTRGDDIPRCSRYGTVPWEANCGKKTKKQFQQGREATNNNWFS